MKTLFTSLLFVLCWHYQSTAQYSIDTTRIDFNNDRIIDTLIDDFSSGSSFGGRDLVIIDGKTEEEFKMSNYGCYCSFTKVIRVPKNLQLEKNRSFLNVIKKEALNGKKKDTIDATLEWMISGAFDFKREREHPFFNLIVNPKTQWRSHKPFIPESYYINISGDSLETFSPNYEKDTIVGKSEGYLTYFTGSHYIETLDSLQPVAKNKNYQIYKTPHTVYVKKGDAHRWLFISDAGLTGAPDRLRWHSMGQVQVMNGYVIIHQDMPPANAYVIHIVNIETQRVGSLNYSTSRNNGTDEGGMDSFEIIDNHLVFTEYGEQEIKRVPLQELFDSLDKHN